MLYKKIEFISPYEKGLIHPVPIKKLVPNWYKEMKNFHNNSIKYPTVKKCVPFLDSLTSGYAILNVADIIFKKINDGQELTWVINDNFPSDQPVNTGVNKHFAHQISEKMIRNDEDGFPLKLLNPWTIRTPKNYSCLFTNPFNYSKDRKIRILDAIVDTDVFDLDINFPFFIKNLPNEEEYVFKKGEIVALVFPFLRNNWKMKISDKSEINGKSKLIRIMKAFSGVLDNYKNNFWRRKKYD